MGGEMAPPYIFRIDEFTENPNIPEALDKNGKWIPSSIPGHNIRRPDGASGKWWFCYEDNIRLLNGWNPPAGSLPYKTFSTVYSDGHGFHVLNGDATNPPASESWHDLFFDWDERTLSSALTNAGTQRALRVQNPNERWPHMLLPNIYHGPSYAFAGYGGLTGDLPIFLAMIAFSMKPERLVAELPKLMQDGEWKTHQRSHGRTHKRGVIVYVYAYKNNDEELKALENGSLGYYYN